MQLRRKLVSMFIALAATATGGWAAPASAATGADPGAPAPFPGPAYGNRYYMANSSGAVWPLGGAPGYGSLAGRKLAQPVVGISVTPDSGGYRLVASDGGVFSFGDARFYGSTGGVHLDRPIVGITPTPDGAGYWLVASDGGIFAYGDARFYGSTGSVPLQEPIVGMAPTPDGAGYWLVASDGGIFAYGDARFHGSMSGSGHTVEQVVADQDGAGYWEVDHQGDVFPFGSATGAAIPTVALMHTIAGPGDVAMEWAMAQLGKPYAWGGTGPAAFDCSGLVMRAWQAAGVTIPRVAADQYDFGARVPIADLRIGDLVYWATKPGDPATIEHVAMYIGGEHMVNAPYAGQVVRTDWISGAGFVDLGTRP